MATKKLFFSSGSCFDEILEVTGTFVNGVYNSALISGTYQQEFYDRLEKKAQELKKYIVLNY